MPPGCGANSRSLAFLAGVIPSKHFFMKTWNCGTDIRTGRLEHLHGPGQICHCPPQSTGGGVELLVGLHQECVQHGCSACKVGHDRWDHCDNCASRWQLQSALINGSSFDPLKH